MMSDQGVFRDENDAGPTMSRRERKAAATRHALYQAGLSAFSRRPISLVSVLDITEEADVAKGVFYLHFSSKDEFLLALWEDASQELVRRIRESVSRHLLFSERICETVRAYGHFFHDSPDAARFWVRMSSYFPDEISEPGRLSQLRWAFRVRLASTIFGRGEDELTNVEISQAGWLDAICWAFLLQESQGMSPGLDIDEIVRVVSAALADESD